MRMHGKWHQDFYIDKTLSLRYYETGLPEQVAKTGHHDDELLQTAMVQNADEDAYDCRSLGDTSRGKLRRSVRTLGRRRGLALARFQQFTELVEFLLAEMRNLG